MGLKYLFTVEYTDGTTKKQTPQDNSKLEPDTRSEFYDVLHSGKSIKTFTLREHTLFFPKWLSVDLTTGKLTHNLNKKDIFFEGDMKTPPPKKRELIFYRQHQHDFNQQTHQEIAHRVTYCIGWQANIDGKNYKQIWGVT